MNKVEKIVKEFNRIKKLGFVKSNRVKNKDGGIGNTFEDYLGVEENNLKDPDFEGFEIKTQRELTSSYITLFSKSPSYPKGANAILKEKYGEVRDSSFPDLKKLYASVFGNKWSEVYGKYFMKMHVDYSNNRVYLHVKNGGEIYDEVYWNFEDLEKGLNKLNKLFVVSAEQKSIDNIYHYHYNSGTVFLDIDFNEFLKILENGFIQFDIRIGVYKSGKNYGKPHDHGSGFRIKKESLYGLYKEKLEL
ncbi:MvaI/BcnI family restriction endonuclease [Flavobacteriaceae bacterium LSUCC0859]|jgi:hypothetical protein|nr:MvaI/BcnI family restriction endonuclease [Flavobacteriaceae bacterium LSUCC0859]